MAEGNNQEHVPSLHEQITRRQVLKTGAALTATALLAADAPLLYNAGKDQKKSSAPNISVPTPKETGPKVDWTVDRLQAEIRRVVNESLTKNEEVTLTLPEGEILIDKVATPIIPEGAKIKIQGHENGTKLRLDPNKSDIPKGWGSFAERSLLYFKNMEGELTIDGVQFDGGSERAGKYGYKPPASPWDAMVFIVGKGFGEIHTKDDDAEKGFRDGEKYGPAMEHAGERKGKASVRNCYFGNSESEGVMMQNLKNAEISNSSGKNLDVLFNASWCDTVVGYDCKAENCVSDGTYITSAQDVYLENWQITTARQAFDLQGVKMATLKNCLAVDSAYGYAFSLSETDGKTVSDTISMIDCNSNGCWAPFTIGRVENLIVNGGFHDQVGAWIEGYRKKDFMHYDGIVDPDGIARGGSSIIEYDPTPPHPTTFSNVKMRISPSMPSNYYLINKQGVTYYK